MINLCDEQQFRAGKDHVTNEEVRNKIQDAIGKHDGLLSIATKHKTRWRGHV